jgi:thymidylate synthase (FAD)
MNVTLIRHTVDADQLAGQAAALCYKGKNPERSLDIALGGGHESVAEHNAFTFLVEGVSRVLLAQITRHRLASFSVESQRYCGANLSVVTPKSMYSYDLIDDIADVKEAVERLYKHALALGVPEEDARYFTLQGGKTQFMVTMNVRELRHFFSLRCCSRAQWEIRELANEMLKLCKEVAPALFADAGPGCVRGHCPEGTKSCGRGKKSAEVENAGT